MSKRIGKDAVEDFIFRLKQNYWSDDGYEQGIRITNKELEEFSNEFLEDFE